MRAAIVAAAALVLAFAVEGGEYGTSDLWSQRGRRAALDAEVGQLTREVDSLRVELQAIRTDNARLERIAREQFGMIRGDKELLYWVGDGSERDSAKIVVSDRSKSP
jgi:cell division protein FtsB